MDEIRQDFKASDCVVYFVDDDRAMIHSSVQWLTLSGLKVQAFVDPKMLLKTIKLNSLCVVVSDIKMPDLDGMSLMQHLLAKDKNLPVILITGHGDIPLAVEAIKKGAFEFITKPFSPEKLLETIKIAQAERVKHLNSQCETEKLGADQAVANRLNIDGGDASENVGPLNARLDGYEKSVIEAAMKKHSGDIALVLEELNLPRRTLNAKMKKYAIIRRNYK